MKKILIITCALTALAAAFSIGWYCGQQSTVKLAGGVLQAQEFSHGYTQLAHDEVVLEEINSGKIEDAKDFIRLDMDGNILGINLQASTNSDASISGFKILLKMDENSRSNYGTHQEVANKLLARVAKYRAEHPWTYTGSLPHITNADVDAKVAVILRQASESQKSTQP